MAITSQKEQEKLNKGTDFLEICILTLTYILKRPIFLEMEMNNDESEESSETEETTCEESATSASKTDEKLASADNNVDEDTVNEADRRPPFFTFHMVNSYGSTEVDGIRNDGNPIKFSSNYILMGLIFQTFLLLRRQPPHNLSDSRHIIIFQLPDKIFSISSVSWHEWSSIAE